MSWPAQQERQTLTITSCSWFYHNMTQPEGQTFLWFPEEWKKYCCEAQGLGWRHADVSALGLSWRQRDFLLLPIHQFENSTYRHLKSTAPPQVIPEKCPPTLGNRHFDTWMVALSRIMMLGGKHTWINFPLPLQSVHLSGLMALVLVFLIQTI